MDVDEAFLCCMPSTLSSLPATPAWHRARYQGWQPWRYNQADWSQWCPHSPRKCSCLKITREITSSFPSKNVAETPKSASTALPLCFPPATPHVIAIASLNNWLFIVHLFLNSCEKQSKLAKVWLQRLTCVVTMETRPWRPCSASLPPRPDLL